MSISCFIASSHLKREGKGLGWSEGKGLGWREGKGPGWSEGKGCDGGLAWCKRYWGLVVAT